MRWKLFVLCISFFHISVWAQVKYASQDKKALKYYAEAHGLLRRAQFVEAIELFSKAVDRDPNFIEAWKSMGMAYQRLMNYDEAIPALKKSIDLNPTYHRSIDTYFNVAQIQYERGEYEEALEYFVDYARKNPGNPNNERIADFYVKNIRFAIAAKENPFPYNPTPLPQTVNQFKLQYFPVLTVDQNAIFFTARKGIKLTEDENLYVAMKDTLGKWRAPESVSAKINTPFNEGACAISADGRTLIFTSCNGRKGYGNCDLYIVAKSGEEWGTPKNMGPEINSAAWEAQPSLSADGRTLYFVSNRPGGKGGKDIWMSRAVSRTKWKTPQNLGDMVNTSKDEISPFIHVNGESLFFSSKGHVGMGGYDIFLAERYEGVWSKPRNLGYPLNDLKDQVSLYISSDGKKGYYTVETVTENDLDSKLYSIDIPDEFRIEHRSNYLSGHIKDAETGAFLRASLQLYNLQDAKLISSVSSDQLSGEYTIVLTEGTRYGIYVGKKGYMFKDFAFDYDDVENFDTANLEIELTPISKGASQALNNIYFDLNSYQLKRESFSELDFIANFLRVNKTVSVQINGHTDDRGTEKYNYELSVNRARAVYDYLLKKRLPKTRVTFKGFGASSPLVPNDSDENRSKNRRIEFEIVRF